MSDPLRESLDDVLLDQEEDLREAARAGRPGGASARGDDGRMAMFLDEDEDWDDHAPQEADAKGGEAEEGGDDDVWSRLDLPTGLSLGTGEPEAVGSPAGSRATPAAESEARGTLRGMESAEPSERLKGVFSTTTQATVGFGGTKKKIDQTVYFYVEEQPDGGFVRRMLNADYAPMGAGEPLAREDLLKHYLPEPTVYQSKTKRVMERLDEQVAEADAHREKGELFTAEFEYKGVLQVDEEHIRATFGLGLTYLERGEAERGDVVFRRLVKMEGAYRHEHKHLFNEFGIKLRKNGMHAQALKYYARAFKLTKCDEHLLYNMARVLYDKSRFGLALKFLRKAKELRGGDFPEAEEFMQAIRSRIQQSSDLIQD